ncbi:beta-galactosidase trimerization domain-containing protein, partial [Eubacteriales bacterium OttesenSCG-928-A19]|nr:beta-galactosidase trimerization domain-containing protein [Eubacteriales bacterium OttesenSCG-928-A19]
FFNAPHSGPCSCDHCQKKYREVYGEALPTDAKDYRPDWMSRILRDCVDKWYKQVKDVKPNIPLILYYAISHDNLYDRLATCDMICCEPQDVLSLGWQRIPQSWKPALCIRLGRSEPEIAPVPFGIVHSCPGMDWRHTGLPPAEYRYWLSQIPANGGMIWHSITGFADTISDKRILDCVSEVNHNIAKVEELMFTAKSTAEVALLWSMTAGKGGMAAAFMGQVGNAAEGWAEAMINRQVGFDVVLPEQILKGRLAQYRVAVMPQGTSLDAEMTAALKAFVEGGGRLIVEGVADDATAEALAMLGITDDIVHSEPLLASYLRFEPVEGGNPLQKGLEHTPIIAHRGVVQYVEPLEGVRTLATLVPPFAPLEAVGAPPERASIPNPQSDLPLCLLHASGKGQVLLVPFALSELVTAYKLGEHSTLVENMVDMLLDGQRRIVSEPVRGLQVIGYENGGAQLIHLVNGVGQRPLDTTVPLTGLSLRVRWDGPSAPKATAMLSGEAVEVAYADGVATITVPRLEVWDVLKLEA